MEMEAALFNRPEVSEAAELSDAVVKAIGAIARPHTAPTPSKMWSGQPRSTFFLFFRLVSGSWFTLDSEGRGNELATSMNAALAKLAIGIASITALAGVTGRLASNNPVSRQAGTAPAAAAQEQPANPFPENGGLLFGNEGGANGEERNSDSVQLVPPASRSQLQAQAGGPPFQQYRYRTRTRRS